MLCLVVFGDVAKWSKVLDWNSFYGGVGSNPAAAFWVVV